MKVIAIYAIVLMSIGACVTGDGREADMSPAVNQLSEDVDIPPALDASAHELVITSGGAKPMTGCIAIVGYDCNNIAQGSDIAQADRVCMSRCDNRPMHCVISYRPGSPAACKTAGPNGGDGLSYCIDIGECPDQCFVGTCVTGYRP